MMREELVKLLEDARLDLENKQIIIWGRGNTAKLYKDNITRLEEEGLNIVGYTDSNCKTQNTEECYNGKPIIFLGDIRKLSAPFVVICSMSPSMFAEIEQVLKKQSIEYASIDKVIFSRHSSDVIACYDLLEDMESKRVYASLVRARMNVVNPSKDIVCPEGYYAFSPFDLENENEVMVECGGYDGATLEAYIRKKNGRFCQVISFEPDANNMERMEETARNIRKEFDLGENKIKLFPYGVGEKEGEMFIARSEKSWEGNLSMISAEDSQNGEIVKIVSLDNFLATPYSFLKMDVEGYEQKIIRGAQNGIKRYKPLLAISIYHNGMQFYEIPMQIKKLVPEYKLAVRCVLEKLSATVVYAYVAD